MTRIRTAPEKLQIKFQYNQQGMDFDSVKDTFGLREGTPSLIREPNFAELHALFEIQYEQFLTDTSDEIANRARRLSELESIVFGTPTV